MKNSIVQLSEYETNSVFGGVKDTVETPNEKTTYCYGAEIMLFGVITGNIIGMAIYYFIMLNQINRYRLNIK
ncbi:hypothetical protein GAMM_40234 [Gammaproteobacteria bacterium]